MTHPYTFGRTMRGELVAKTMLPLGDVAHPRRELHIETSKAHGGGIETTGAVFERTEDGLGLVHAFALSRHGTGDFRLTMDLGSGRATEKAIRTMHERALLNRADEVLNMARGFYVAQQVNAEREAANRAVDTLQPLYGF